MSYITRRIWLYLAAAAVLLIVSEVVQAADTADGFHVLNGIDSTFKPYQYTWAKTIMPYARKLFWMLVTLDFSWTAVIWALEKNDFNEIIVSLVKKFMTIGFFFTLLKLSNEWLPAIISSFSMIGKNAAGLTDAQATPDGVIGVGYTAALSIFDIIGTLSLGEKIALALPLEFLGIVIFLGFLYIGIHLLVLLVESYIVIGGGVILLGFGGSRWTTDFATKYLQYAVSVGVRLMVLYLVIGVGSTISAKLVSSINQNDLIASVFQVLGVALSYAFIVLKVDNIASGMMSGASSSSAGDIMSSALSVGAAMAGGAAAMQGAGKGASGLASKASSGLEKALGAGTNAIQDVGAGGGLGDALSGGNSSSSSTPAAPSSTSSPSGGASSSSPPAPSSSSSSSSAPSGSSASSSSPSSAGASSNSPAAPSSGKSSGEAPSGGAQSDSVGSNDNSSPEADAAGESGASSNTGTPTASADTAPPSPQSASSNQSQGDASTASIGGGDSNASPPNNKPPEKTLHKRIQELQGYIPQNNAPTAAPQINLGHTQD